MPTLLQTGFAPQLPRAVFFTDHVSIELFLILIMPFTAAILSEVNETSEAETITRRFCLLGSTLLPTEALRWMFYAPLHERENENESSRSRVVFLSFSTSSNSSSQFPQAGARLVLPWTGAGGMGKNMGQRGDRPSFEREHPRLTLCPPDVLKRSRNTFSTYTFIFILSYYTPTF